MTYLSGLLGFVALAMMATLVLLAVRRDRALSRNAPDKVVGGTGGPGTAGPGTAGSGTVVSRKVVQGEAGGQ
ncbi:hypothetical protein ACQPZP_08620 [Spirillospora sp. CA-142024]|uniref:hypothetical protein n=1 Tax=Spirillospora sp. CA-142024 TaxID=3240036 RepID=UPI003D8BFD10